MTQVLCRARMAVYVHVHVLTNTHRQAVRRRRRHTHTHAHTHRHRHRHTHTRCTLTGASARWSCRGSSAMVVCPTAVFDSLLSLTAACMQQVRHEPGSLSIVLGPFVGCDWIRMKFAPDSISLFLLEHSMRHESRAGACHIRHYDMRLNVSYSSKKLKLNDK